MVYDTLEGKKRPFVPIEDGFVKIYVCGVTPYADAHIGHARPAVFWDVVRRHLERRGYRVLFVQNYTDIDDKLVGRAKQLGRTVDGLADEHIAGYEAMMAKLGVRPPDIAPRVTDHIEQIQQFVQDLIDQHKAYVGTDGVYFDVKQDAQYGRLSGQRLDEMQQGVRHEVAAGKRDAIDFALWKNSDPEDIGWQAPWGFGRPGWHIECSAMSACYLGASFDFHGGGVDLVFPHHENERAQSRAQSGQEPAGAWVHSGLVTQGAVKMSKSLGNGRSLGDLLKLVDPVVVRTYLLSVQYRTPLEFDEEHLMDWMRGMQRIWRLWEDVYEAAAPTYLPDDDWAKRMVSFEMEMLEALDDDFNTARALSVVFDMVRAARKGQNTPHIQVSRGLARSNLLKADALLGILPTRSYHESQRDDEPSSLLTRLLEWRNLARGERQWLVADRIRDILQEGGYVIEDTADGPIIRRVQSDKD